MSVRCGAHCAVMTAALVALILGGGCGRKPEGGKPSGDEVYRLPLTDNPLTLDPALFTGVDSEGVACRIFNALAKLDAALRPVPDLAERWETSSDGLSYTFFLRKGARFHNGREVTAEDVRYSFERLLRKETVSRRAWVVEPIAGARKLRAGKADSLSGLEVVGRYAVRIRLREPFAPFLSQIAMTNAAIVPREEVERPGSKFGRRPVGTGPFKFVEWRDNDFLFLERNDGYFNGPAKLGGIRFRVIKEPFTAYREYLAGNLEHCAVPSGYHEKIASGPMKAQLRTVATLSTYYLGMIMTREPCGTNVHLRRALNYAVNRGFLCEKVLGGSHVPAKGILPPGLPGYDERLEGYRYDPKRARVELARGGFGPDRPVPELTLYFNSRPPGMQVAQAVQSDLKQVGIVVRLRPMDMGALRHAVNKTEPDIFRLSWIADFPDADNFLYIFHSGMHGSSGNRVRYTNVEVDALLDGARREVVAERRLALLMEAERKIVADAPWVFVSHRQTQLLVKPYVKHFNLTPMDVGTSVNRVDFHQVSISPR